MRLIDRAVGISAAVKLSGTFGRIVAGRALRVQYLMADSTMAGSARPGL